MQILAVDVGTGTQDILLFDSRRAPENCLKLVMPSPTLAVAGQIRRATQAGQPVVLTGVTMGGGPSAWAAEDHRRAGLPLFATPDAARSFNDDLDLLQREMGMVIVSPEEAAQLAARPEIAHVVMRDFDFAAIRQAFAAFGVALEPEVLAVAVFDHGNAPPDVSDRQFRLDYLARRLAEDRRLSTFAFPADAIPPIMTRLQAAVSTARDAAEHVLAMDTAPAAVLGALQDPQVAAQPDALVVNVGNFHCLAFQYRGGEIVRLFEHHTGLLSPEQLEAWLCRLADGSITHQAVFAEHGHGALVLDGAALPVSFVAVTGPRRAMLARSRLPIYFAVPHGDQMMAGCWGMVVAAADLLPQWREEILAALSNTEAPSLW